MQICDSGNDIKIIIPGIKMIETHCSVFIGDMLCPQNEFDGFDTNSLQIVAMTFLHPPEKMV